MTFETIHFRAVEVDEASIICFPAGLPGFEGCRRFAILGHPTAPGLSFVQSLERAGLCFLALPVQSIRPGYQLLLTEEDAGLLGTSPGAALRIGEDVLAFAILSLAEGEPPTANLLSPLVIHLPSRRAVQAIRPDQAYGCREPLVSEELVCS